MSTMNFFTKSYNSLPKMVIYALMSSKCREWHLCTFVGNQTTNGRFLPIYGGGGGGSPKADNVHFITFVFHDSFPKLDGTLSPLRCWDMLTRAQGWHVSVETTANP